MDTIRKEIQTALANITGLESGVPLPDDMIEYGVTYFGYTLSENFIDSDFDRHYGMQIAINGHVVRRNNNAENTLSILDSALDQIKTALKSLNFTYSYDDVTIDDNIRKIHLTGDVRYNEINNWLI